MSDTQEAAPAPKPKRGSWHEWAKQMREQGYTFAQIAQAVGVSAPAVYFALNPDKRWDRYKKKGVKAAAPTPPAPPAQD